MSNWYAVHTRPRQEERAQENLQRQGFNSWLPRLRRQRRHARRTDTILVPLFPGYLFVSLDLDIERWRSINGTFGVIRLLNNGDAPILVPNPLIEKIMQMRDGSGVVVIPPRRLVAGDTVKVALGPLVDLQGMFEEMAGPERVVLLLNLLGRKVRANLPLAGLAA